jgi:hypothetical protein
MASWAASRIAAFMSVWRCSRGGCITDTSTCYKTEHCSENTRHAPSCPPPHDASRITTLDAVEHLR